MGRKGWGIPFSIVGRTAVRHDPFGGCGRGTIGSAVLRSTGDPAGGRWVSAMIAAMATLSRADVEHVAHLARLGLSDEELTRLEAQLNHILDQYSILARLDTESIPPTAQTIEIDNILRDDVPG